MDAKKIILLAFLCDILVATLNILLNPQMPPDWMSKVQLLAIRLTPDVVAFAIFIYMCEKQALPKRAFLVIASLCLVVTALSALLAVSVVLIGSYPQVIPQWLVDRLQMRQ